ncbi:MAG: hypothetical protein H0V57_06520 [Thermoleophilaceae bacterium]|nr:hypothetical protein [Thermoleophilaceae bacterium]
MWRLAPTLLSVVGAVVYLVLGPRSPDLAAHVFRSELFGREGFTIWTGQWYSGHHTPAYSVLSPPLGWLLGPQLLGAASSVAATACFEAITRRHYGTRSAAWGAVWFGVASVTLLFTARLTFSLGVAFGLAALLALQRRRPRSAVALAVLSVRPAGEWTKVRASRRGVLLLSTRFGAERLVARGRPCDELPEARADAEELEQRLERLSGGAWPLRHSAASARRS